MGNETYPGKELSESLYALAKRLDPTRPVIDTDGTWGNITPTLDYCSLGFNLGWLPWGDRKDKYIRKDAGIPIIVHEMANLLTLPNPADVPKFSGMFKPFWLEEMADKVKEKNLQQYLPAMLEASWKLQSAQYKVNNEAARLSPAIDGYHQWLFRDYWYQSSGWVNMFDDTRAITPEIGRQINGPAVWLWQRSRGNFRSGEQVTLDFYLSDFRLGRREQIAELTVTLEDLQVTPSTPSQAGQSGLVGPWRIELKMPVVKEPRRLTLRAQGGGYHNEWPLWVFPRHDFDVNRSSITIKSKLNEGDLEKLETGQSLFLLDGRALVDTIPSWFKLGWWKGGAGNHVFGTMIMEHPSMDRFPHDGYGDFQMYDMIASQHVMLLDDLPATLEPIMWCLDEPSLMRRKAYLFEAKVGPSKVLVTTLDFSPDVRARDPAADWLYHELIQYCSSPDFAPQQELPLEWFKAHPLTSPSPQDDWLEGFGEIVAYAEAGTYRSSIENRTPCYTLRQSDGLGRTVWRTAIVPEDWKHETATFVWSGGFGWASKPFSGHFTLFVNDRKVMDLPFSLRPAIWKSDGYQLRFQPARGHRYGDESLGLFYLTVPSSVLKPGEPATIKMTASKENSARWFNLYPHTNVVARQREQQ
jgi:hypothetical protein